MNAGEARQNGRMIRQTCKRSSLGNWEYRRDRDHVIELLKEQERTRIQDLIPVRHERMSASPFAFYRGAAIIMADDLFHTPGTGITVQACGDAHIANFGAFASPERRLVFDINDFDETLPGPWEWDVKRLIKSIEICGRYRGFSAVASMCAWTLAHAHAKTGDRHGIAGYLGRSDAFEEAMLRFARAYADQNERDFEVFCASN